MHRFGLVLPFLDTLSSCCVLRVCRSARPQLVSKIELGLECWSEVELKLWEQQPDFLDRLTGLDFACFPFPADPMFSFLSLGRLRNLRVLRLPQFVGGLVGALRIPSSLTELTAELIHDSVVQLGELPRLAKLKLHISYKLDLSLLSKVCPNLTSLALDATTSEDCQGELTGLDSLTELRVENWTKRVPLTVMHLEVSCRHALAFAPSNIDEIAKTLVTLKCGFPWPAISEWPRLEQLVFLKPVWWEITDAPALHTFECKHDAGTLAMNKQIRLRTLRVPVNRLNLANHPSSIEHLCLTAFQPSRMSLPEFTGLRSLELHGNMFTKWCPYWLNSDSLEEFTLINGHEKRIATFQFLRTMMCPNLRRLQIEMGRYNGWVSKPIPMLSKLETVDCDFFHKTLFQPQVKHLTITSTNPRLPNRAILEALKQCKRLESLRTPLRPGLETLILEMFPLLVVTKTMQFDAEH